MKMRNLLQMSLLTLSLALVGCNFDGGVEQGRCVAFDENAKTITVVVDVTLDPANPHYSGGVHQYKLPAEARDMGQTPVVGKRLMFDTEKGTVLLYDPEANATKEIKVEFTDVEKNIDNKHPKVKDKTFPMVDKDKGTVTVHSRRLKSLITFKPAPELLDMPADTWLAGDEMRIAYRNSDKSQAIRIMNVSTTNIFAK